ncbi:thioesterase family protein [Algiphilus sp.]|uniref:acyl-CoA thioesterase n=1 Tax=Algiphilus sp. TaxID=1872431 RepID=UPI0025BAC546|nr:thioesterase family protein [Algiphilus sp.]MCK5769836.1 thioesterase family protein [Algiphilus sp.]
MTTTTFDQLLDGMQPQAGDGCYGATLTEDWLQGRAAFGGLMAAMAVRAMRAELGPERPLRALLTAFVGPAGEGGLDITAGALRSGKSVTWAEARIAQSARVCTTLSGCFGDSRASAIRVPPPSMPATPGVEDSRSFPSLPGITPAFTQHFDMRWAIGDMPMSGSAQSEMGVWVRFREPGDFGEAHIVALMDLLPPAVLQMQRAMKPISTLTWHLDLLDTLDADDARDGGGWWYFHVHAQAAANGYSQQNATLFTPAGRALAMSQQSIAVFA